MMTSRADGPTAAPGGAWDERPEEEGRSWSLGGAEGPLTEPSRRRRFADLALPHLGAAYNLARWLTRDDHDAEDVVQEAALRAYQFFDGFHGYDGRAWLLKIVRNTCYTWLEKNRVWKPESFDEEKHGVASPDTAPDARLQVSEDKQLLRHALDELPAEYREVIVLRELEGLSYKEIAGIADIPMGTVMSRLARARERLLQSLTGLTTEEP
jgi:RNA polymerase sigma factor (sigma-70 family)